MTIEELSERIINGDLLKHSDDYISKTEFQHYGVLGMKWGVRKDRQRKGESDQQYKERMDRESRERIASADRKAREKEQKRALKSQERIQKAQIRSNERKDAAQRKAQEKNQAAARKAQEKQQEKEKIRTRDDRNKDKKSAGLMTDAELDRAINRMRKENEYASLSKRPESAASKATKAIGKTALSIGKDILVSELTLYGARKVAKSLGNPEPKRKGEGGDGKSKKAAQTIKKAVKTASDLSRVVNDTAETFSKNSQKLDLDAFNEAWKTKIYYDDEKR